MPQNFADQPIAAPFVITRRETTPAVTLPFAEFLILLSAQKYTGPVTFHCFNGVPTSAELAADPIQIRLTHAKK